MSDNKEIESRKSWRDRADWWELFVTVAPILVGIGVVGLLSVLDLIFRSNAATDWNQRILLGMLGIIVGISLQFKGISKEFQKLKIQSDKNSRKLAVELSEAIGIPVASASSENSSIRRIYRIAEKSNRIDKNLEHLTAESRAIIRHWADTYLSSVESEVSDFARRSARFDGIRGLEADEDLISSAQRAVLASTPVSRENMDFWMEAAGKKYRESLTSLIAQHPIFKEEPDTLECVGVARVFTFSPETLSQIEGGVESGLILFEQAVAEAKLQQDMGIEVRFLSQSDLSDDDLAELDVLIVDGCICSKTIHQDPVNTRSRSVVVNWDKSGLQRIAGDWRLIWRRAISIDEFMEDERLENVRNWLDVPAKEDLIEDVTDDA